MEFNGRSLGPTCAADDAEGHQEAPYHGVKVLRVGRFHGQPARREGGPHLAHSRSARGGWIAGQRSFALASATASEPAAKCSRSVISLAASHTTSATSASEVTGPGLAKAAKMGSANGL